MQQYVFLPHTADIAMQACGSSKEELIRAALQGMCAAAEPERNEPSQSAKRAFAVSSQDFPSLVVDILNEAIAQSDTYHEVYDNVTFDELTETKAKGILSGQKVKAFGTQIKAATHHDLTVQQHDQEWEAVIIFDA